MAELDLLLLGISMVLLAIVLAISALSVLRSPATKVGLVTCAFASMFFGVAWSFCEIALERAGSAESSVVLLASLVVASLLFLGSVAKR